MSASFNQVTLIGRLTKDPELRYTAAGMGVANLSLAVDRRFKKEGEEKPVTDFFEVSTFRQTAEFAANYLGKGRLVVVTGRIEINDGQDREGNARRFTNIVCEQLIPLDSAREGSDAGAKAAAPAAPAAQAQRAPQARPKAAPAPSVPAADEQPEGYDGDDPFSDE